MTFTRKPVGDPLTYKEHTIQARHMGPDVLCYVDDIELPTFYLTAEAARNAGCRYVDQIKREAK